MLYAILFFMKMKFILLQLKQTYWLLVYLIYIIFIGKITMKIYINIVISNFIFSLEWHIQNYTNAISTSRIRKIKY